MKKIIHGWVSKRSDLDNLTSWKLDMYDNTYLLKFEHLVFKTPGKKIEWYHDEWPPKKVKITIEYVDPKGR